MREHEITGTRIGLPGVVVGIFDLGPIQEASALAPLPAAPPIGGAIWTVVIPAALFLGAFLGTYLLYKRFSKVEGE
jgi:hypothetical protein